MSPPLCESCQIGIKSGVKHLVNQSDSLGLLLSAQLLSGNYIAPDKALFSAEKLLIIFLFVHENIRCGYSLEVRHL